MQGYTKSIALFAVLLGMLLSHDVGADIILSTDFEGTTENGTTLEGVSYTTMGVTVPASLSDLTVTNTVQRNGNGNLFTTGLADGVFAVANNTGNGGEWNFQIEFSTGADAIELDDFSFEWLNFNGSGGNQFAVRNTEVTIDILTGGVSAISGPLAQNTAIVNTGNGSVPAGNPPSAGAGAQPDSIGLAGNTLAANTTYTLFVQAGDATTGGNNFGFESITLNGTIASAIPEPGSALLVGLVGLGAGLRRRRRFA